MIRRYPTLRAGAAGAPVALLQQALSRASMYSPSGAPTSVYDTQTTNAVKAFQTKHSLIVDGITGRQTWGQLVALGLVPPINPPSSLLVEFQKGTLPGVTFDSSGIHLTSASADLSNISTMLQQFNASGAGISLPLTPEMKTLIDGYSSNFSDLPFVGDFLTIKVPTNQSTADVAKALAAMPSVKSATPSAYVSTLGADPLVGTSDQMTNPGTPKQWYVFRTRANKAWAKSTGKGVALFIVDTGFRHDHEDLKNRIDTSLSRKVSLTSNYQMVLNPSSPVPKTGVMSDHGTQVMGIAGAEYNNSVGIAGIAHGATLVGVEIRSVSQNDVAAGIVYAATAPTLLPRVINVSVGLVDYKEVTYTAADGSQQTCLLPSEVCLETDPLNRFAIYLTTLAGSVVCLAAGNSARDASYDLNGALLPDTGSIMTSGTKYDSTKNVFYTNFAYGKRVDILAPGGPREIMTTLAFSSKYYRAIEEGTSLASPMTAATAALIRSVKPSLTPSQVRQIIRDTALAHTAPAGIKIGTGTKAFLNAEAAVNKALTM